MQRVSYPILLVSTSLFLLFLAMNIRNYEAFEDAPGPGIFPRPSPPPPPLQVATMVKTILGPYMDPRVCSIFLELRLKIIPTNSKTGSPTDSEAIEKTDKQLQLEIPGGPAPCPFPKLPADSADPKVWLEYVNALPRDILARILFTAEYCLRTLQQKQAEISSATAGSTQGFQPLCPPSLADTRRAEKAASSKTLTAATCVNPEELTPEQIGNQIQILLQDIQGKSTQAYKKPLNPKSLPAILNECEAIKQKLDGVKNQAQSGTLPYPQVA